MLKTPESDWAKMGVDGGAAPWTQGVCIAQEVQLNANMFLQSEGSVAKILEVLERAKFPTVEEASKIVKATQKAATKLPPVSYEGQPLNIYAYRALETLGTVFVTIVMGIALGATILCYNWVDTYIPDVL